MEVSRRQFLKVLGVSIGALAIDPMSFVPETNAYAHFNPKLQYGGFVYTREPIDGKGDPKFREAVQMFDQVIVESIPEPYRGKIRWIIINPQKGDPFAQVGTIGWKYVP